RPGSAKLADMLAAWQGWGFKPRAVVVEQLPEPPALARLHDRVRQRGVAGLGAQLMRKLRPAAAGGGAAAPDALAWCRAQGIDVIEVGPLDSEEAVAAVTRLAPDLL